MQGSNPLPVSGPGLRPDAIVLPLHVCVYVYSSVMAVSVPLLAKRANAYDEFVPVQHMCTTQSVSMVVPSVFTNCSHITMLSQCLHLSAVTCLHNA